MWILSSAVGHLPVAITNLLVSLKCWEKMTRGYIALVKNLGLRIPKLEHDVGQRLGEAVTITNWTLPGEMVSGQSLSTDYKHLLRGREKCCFKAQWIFSGCPRRMSSFQGREFFSFRTTHDGLHEVGLSPAGHVGVTRRVKKVVIA